MPDAIYIGMNEVGYNKFAKREYKNLIPYKNYYIYHHDDNDVEVNYEGFIWTTIFIPLFTRWANMLIRDHITFTKSDDYKRLHHAVRRKDNTRSMPYFYKIDGNLYIKHSQFLKGSMKHIANEYHMLLFDAPKPILKANFQRIVFSKSKDRLLGGLFDI